MYIYSLKYSQLVEDLRRLSKRDQAMLYLYSASIPSTSLSLLGILMGFRVCRGVTSSSVPHGENQNGTNVNKLNKIHIGNIHVTFKNNSHAGEQVCMHGKNNKGKNKN